MFCYKVFINIYNNDLYFKVEYTKDGRAYVTVKGKYMIGNLCFMVEN